MDTQLKMGFRHIRPTADMVSRAKRIVTELRVIIPGHVAACEIIIWGSEDDKPESYRVSISLDMADVQISIDAAGMDFSPDLSYAFAAAKKAISRELENADLFLAAAD